MAELVIPAAEQGAVRDDKRIPDLSIVIVSYNIRDELQRCLESVAVALEHGGIRGEILLVENGSSDGTLEMLNWLLEPEAGNGLHGLVKVLANRQNTGFTRGNNQALACAGGRFVLLLNPDTEVAPDALAILLDYLETHPDVGMAGPLLRYSDGSIQPSRRRFPTPATLMVESTVLQRLFGRSRLLRSFYMADMPDECEQEVDWLVGACMLLRREVIEEIGLLDERFFMYSEELDWCRRIKAAGWKIVFLPQAQVMHYEGRSSAQNVLARHVYFNNSKLKYSAKYFGGGVTVALRLWLLLNFIILIAEDGLKYLLRGQKRAMRRARMGQLLIVCRWLITGKTGRDLIDGRL